MNFEDNEDYECEPCRDSTNRKRYRIASDERYTHTRIPIDLDPLQPIKVNLEKCLNIFKNEINLFHAVYIWLDGNSKIDSKASFEQQILYIGKTILNGDKRHLRHYKDYTLLNNIKVTKFNEALNYKDPITNESGKLINFFFRVNIGQLQSLFLEDRLIYLVLKNKKDRFKKITNQLRSHRILEINPVEMHDQLSEYVLDLLYRHFIELRNQPNSSKNKKFEYKEYTSKTLKKTRNSKRSN